MKRVCIITLIVILYAAFYCWDVQAASEGRADPDFFVDIHNPNKAWNGNILITGTTVLLEITPDKEIVWRLILKNVPFRSPKEAPALGFYKAERIKRK